MRNQEVREKGQGGRGRRITNKDDDTIETMDQKLSIENSMIGFALSCFSVQVVLLVIVIGLILFSTHYWAYTVGIKRYMREILKIEN